VSFGAPPALDHLVFGGPTWRSAYLEVIGADPRVAELAGPRGEAVLR
jgi:hypothetical protein